MQIVRSRKYQKNLFVILKYIAADKPSASRTFLKSLDNSIKRLPKHPFKYRKSFYFNNEFIRDLTYMGYTIVYEIKEENGVIELLNIFNMNKPGE